MALKPITMDSVDRFTCLVVGNAGVGKTSLLRTIENEPAIVLSAEGGLLCVRDLVQSGQVQGFEIGSFAEMKEALEYLQTDEAKNTFKWVFIDSLTEISARCVEAMKAKYPSSSDSFKMWGDYSDLLTTLIKAFRDLKPYNVVFTCLPQTDKDEMNRRYIAPAIAGSQLKERLTSYFDEAFYMDILTTDEGEEYRVFYTQPVNRFPAKDRSGKLEEIEEPHLTKIKNKIMED